MNKKYIGFGLMVFPFIAIYIYGIISVGFWPMTIITLCLLTYLAMVTYGAYLLTNQDE